ncbi:MAG: FlgO family outer membrane protein [Myxococcota bacterium]
MTSLVLLAALAAADAKPVVSVLYFENRTGNAEFDVLGKGLAEMMVTDLVAWDGVTVVERERLEAVLGELKLQSSKAFDQATTVKVGKLVGAGYIITGSMHRQGERLRVDARILQVQGGKVVATASIEEHQDKIFEIEQQLTDKLTVAIDVKLKDPAQRKRAKAPNLDALLQYSKAIDLSDRGRVDEAQKAMAAVVSKSPTFGMARERKEYLLKKLQEYEARRKDLVTEAVGELGQLTETELAQVKDFAKLPEPAQQRALIIRGLRGQFLARLLKQALSWRLDSPRVIKVGKETDALKLMQGWLDNQRSLEADSRAWNPMGVKTSLRVPDDLLEKVKAAGFEDDITVDPGWIVIGRTRFVVLGELNDGSHFRVAPPLGVLAPREHDLAMAELDEAITRAEADWKKSPQNVKAFYEGVLSTALEAKAEIFMRLRRDDDAASAWQRLLDTIPNGHRAEHAEKMIKEIIEGGGYERGQRAEFEKDLANCEEFNPGTEVDWYLSRGGLKGLDEIAKLIEDKCLGFPGLKLGWERLYRDLASTAAKAEDCERAKRWHLMKYVHGEVGPVDFDKYLTRDEGWCSYGLTQDTLPSLVRVTVSDFGYKDKREPLIRAGLRDLLPEEFAARGVALETGGSFHGGSRSIYFDVELKGDEVEITIRTSDDNERKVVKSKGGQIVLSELLDPYFKTLRTGAPPGPWKPSKTISVTVAHEYGQAIELFEDRKYAEARAAFEALVKKYPNLRPARVRAQLAAIQERKEQSR